MSRSFDPDCHHRRSIRLRGYDYRQHGCYFVTICVAGRVCIFGEILDGRMNLNPLGEAARAAWEGIPAHFPGVELDAFVVMPNHLHGLVVLATDFDPPNLDSASRLSGPPRGPLGAIVGSFKSSASRQIRDLRLTPGEPVWQRNYYERILRHETGLNRARAYIAANPTRWADDPENPALSERDVP